MAYRADAADPRHQIGHLEKGPAFTEFFKPAKLGNMEVCRFYSSLVVQVDGDFCVSFQPRHRINNDTLGHRRFAYAPKRVRPLSSGWRPSSMSVRVAKMVSAD